MVTIYFCQHNFFPQLDKWFFLTKENDTYRVRYLLYMFVFWDFMMRFLRNDMDHQYLLLLNR